MIVVCDAVQFVLGEQVECHERLWESWVRRASWQRHQWCEAELKCCNLLRKSAVSASGRRHVCYVAVYDVLEFDVLEVSCDLRRLM